MLLWMLLLATARAAMGAVVEPVAVLHTWQRSVAGAGAFAAATILTSPMDVVKTRTQASSDDDTSLAVALEMLRQEGVLCFFSGLAPALLMAPAAMVQYTVIDPLRARFPILIAATIAGALSVTIKCPFDFLKTLRQNDPSNRTARDLFTSTFRDAGVTGLWTGYGATLARDMPYHLLKWGVYVQAQALFRAMTGLSAGAQNLLAGAAAGAIGATVVTPFDVIKTRLQVARGASGSVAIAQKILAEEGAAGLFRGLGLRLARIPFYTSITLATFDGIKDAFISANR
eukprot:CAMPEP_0194166038 /NCGR_PEP_ID=MMETSP0154-20130528/1770_1 /TAXON_ID=1049557 /ORGANISM="Thalassiothrix antarctica, Strain L6-D1" /LENGTH=285 /DNA_ID=CAMNT_0038876615 /DNA_START=183 /DNA_END=1040 /DNA_ORIENTATION=+